MLQPDRGSGSKDACHEGGGCRPTGSAEWSAPAGGARLCSGYLWLICRNPAKKVPLGKEWVCVGYASGSAATLLGIVYPSSCAHR